ncbi:MAG: sn-glycerol-3-phosphate dehydrogenase subunit C [bacterium ADurb.Bin429]|nr:MAG: sn-glycerol-3-phosphate dehydrogenase subunit C [bacterium ADurb.Bin429]
MSDGQMTRKITYEGDLDPHFADEVAASARGEQLFTCIQCGTCGGACPVSPYMDLTPRRIIAMTRAGYKAEVLQSHTIWLCASCYACTVACPKEVRITDVMYALKQRAIRDGVYPKRFPVPVLAREFFHGVLATGRNNELPLLIKMYLKTNIFKMLGQAVMGLRLFLTGRIGLKQERIKARRGEKGDLQTIMAAVDRDAPAKGGPSR